MSEHFSQKSDEVLEGDGNSAVFCPGPRSHREYSQQAWLLSAVPGDEVGTLRKITGRWGKQAPWSTVKGHDRTARMVVGALQIHRECPLQLDVKSRSVFRMCFWCSFLNLARCFNSVCIPSQHCSRDGAARRRSSTYCRIIRSGSPSARGFTSLARASPNKVGEFFNL